MRLSNALKIVLLLALASGCGASALSTNARIAQAMVEIQATAETVVRDGRVDASVQAAQAVADNGGTIVEAEQAATAAAARWVCAVEGHRVYEIAMRTYVDALSLAAAGATFDLVMVLPLLGRSVRAYRALQTCLGTLGADLPAAPDFLDLIPTEWSVPNE